ncbi:hypothetical protein C162_29114 [Paenibacillus sp. FSL R7-269]|uniref:luciferase domain-containing protein n=1 Tax=Paenibacillus sp. FSL R7-269 TaxID=1226755 RepID=UPI0003E28117|nr:luciferase family protein [Paenibacillus sp. FSL R7-269]ETT35891.1 hypothetical protein C162_29114 [Paenibacillus sp. FSL R7-269]
MVYIPFIALVIIFMAWAIWDYKKWKSLGKGGVPFNPYGWLLVSYYRLKKRDPLSLDIYKERIGGPEDSIRLETLPYREGERPRIGVHPVPHRQLDQRPDQEIRQLLQRTFDDYVHAHPTTIHFVKSYYEKRNDAITLREEINGHPVSKITCGEIAHIHPDDSSMHMVFSPSDASEVITKGWGERHSLSGSPILGLPDTYLMIYAPRNAAEVDIVRRLVDGAVQHVCQCTNH